MKVRIISSMIGLVLLFVVFVFFDTVLTNLVIAFTCALAVYELLAATGCTRISSWRRCRSRSRR